MRYVICYDIPETKRRTKLRKNLLRFGNPKQFSVFECDLSSRELERMKKTIKAIISLDEDNVRIYPLCEKCHNSVDFNRLKDVFMVNMNLQQVSKNEVGENGVVNH